MDNIYWFVGGSVLVLLLVTWLWAILASASRADDVLELDEQAYILAAQERARGKVLARVSGRVYDTGDQERARWSEIIRQSTEEGR